MQKNANFYLSNFLENAIKKIVLQQSSFYLLS